MTRHVASRSVLEYYLFAILFDGARVCFLDAWSKCAQGFAYAYISCVEGLDVKEQRHI